MLRKTSTQFLAPPITIILLSERGSGVQGHFQLHSKFGGSLKYMSLSQKTRQYNSPNNLKLNSMYMCIHALSKGLPKAYLVHRYQQIFCFPGKPSTNDWWELEYKCHHFSTLHWENPEIHILHPSQSFPFATGLYYPHGYWSGGLTTLSFTHRRRLSGVITQINCLCLNFYLLLEGKAR